MENRQTPSTGSSPPSLPFALDGLLTVQLWTLLTAFERRLASELQELGTSIAGFRLIGEVMTEPDGVRQAELARRLGVSPPTISAAVTRLEEAGLVFRMQDPDDSRARRVCLSGDTSLLPGVEVLQRMESALFAGLSDDERAGVRRALSTLSERLLPDTP